MPHHRKNSAVFSESSRANFRVEGENEMQAIPLERALVAADNYPKKRLVDELVLVRRAADNGDDFISRSNTGRLTPDIDDTAALCGYADLIRAGYPVKLAGVIMSRIRAAMRDYPEADQLVTVTLENGNRFTLPADTVDLRSGYNSGGYVTFALTADCRNLRERAQRATEVQDAAA
jgi:hypothetical protein